MNILDKKMFYSHFYEKIEEIKDKEMVDITKQVNVRSNSGHRHACH
jgi:hypothetical protein